MADPTGTNTAQNSAIEATIGLNGQTLSVGTFADVEIPWNCSIARWTAVAVPAGSVALDVQMCQETQYDGGATHPVSGDSITAGNGPAITAGNAGRDMILAGWTRSLTAGIILRFILNSVSGIQQLTVSLEVFR